MAAGQQRDDRSFALAIIGIVFGVLGVGGWITILAVGPLYVDRIADASQQKSLSRSQEAVTKASVVEFEQNQLKQEFHVYKETHP